MAVTTGRMWSVYKELFNTIELAIRGKEEYAIQDLEAALKTYKPDFLSLLQNPARNLGDRDAVAKANREGLPIQGHQGSQILTPDFINEVLTLSDLFDLNEVAAVDLLLSAENQQSYFPGLPRGLVAVLLYYDGKASLVNSLKTLIQTREGRTWALPEMSEDLVNIVTKFTDQVMSDGLVGKMLGLLQTFDVTTQISRLQLPEFRALGPPKHRLQVTDKIAEIRLSLASCIFFWSCQSTLSCQDTLLLIGYLSSDSGINPDGTLSDVTLALLMALLYAIDVRVFDQEDAEAWLTRLPITNDPSYIQDVHREICSDTRWANPGLKAVVQFAWAVTLHQVASLIDVGDICDQEEHLVSYAIECDVFFYLRTSIIANAIFHEEEYYLRKIHNLVTDFIVHMPLKVKDLRSSGDETARIIVACQQENLEPPTGLRKDFEHILAMIAELYGKDPLNLELSVEFWCSVDSVLTTGNLNYSKTHNVQPPARQMSLFKFVRLAGDLLLPPLYVPYVNMLAGLANGEQSAYNCFNLLKMNGHGPGSQMNLVSWDHFFMSLNQYYSNLRQEVPLTSDLSPVYRYHRKFITPYEVDGLRAVLKLITVVVQKDENARVALSENQRWMPLNILLGLVGCCVPPKLKAELLQTLAAFAKTPETAANLWQMMEMSQILQASSSAGGPVPGGIQVELEEVEARNEEFPMTLAFLELINVLTENPIPTGLGVGIRAPGFHLYLDFLRDSVFLKFYSRSYKRPAEKWEVGSAVLEILHKLLLAHEVSQEDFEDRQYQIQGLGTTVMSKPPGHTLLLHMLSDSNMLKMILYIIDDATRMFDKYVHIPEKQHLEDVSLLCLKMIETALGKQESFLDALRQSGATVIGSSLDKLLLGINPRTGRSDHLVNIAKYVVHNSFLPKHSLAAVRILTSVCQSPLVQQKIVGLFMINEDLSKELMCGFAECLEFEDPENFDSKEEFIDTDTSLAQVRSLTRESIVRLLLSTVEQPAPNLAHFLCGFELRKSVSKSNLQDPGILGFPRTCLHSIITLLSRGVDLPVGPSCLYFTPRLADLAYCLIYILCTNSQTSGPTLRYLRTHDFLYRQAVHLPFQQKDTTLLTPQSWLIKTVIVELRVTSINRQRSHTQRLINLLLDESKSGQQKRLQNDRTLEQDYSLYDANYSIYQTTTSARVHTTGEGTTKLLRILDSVDFCIPYPPALTVDFFNLPLVEQVISKCEHRNEHGLLLCDVRLLYKILTQECNCLTGALAAQRERASEEIKHICKSVVERNAYRKEIHARKQAFIAWRQAVEILLTACPSDLLEGEKRQILLFELLQDLLNKLFNPDAVPELTSPVAGVILILMANLSQCFIVQQTDHKQVTGHAQYVTLLDAHPQSASLNVSAVTTDMVTGSRTLFASSFQVVLRGLLEHMLQCSAGGQRVRAYLYGALLYYLQIAQKPKPMELSATAPLEKSIALRLSAKDSEYDRLSRENMDTINKFGQSLMDCICKDACDGHDVGRMLALGALDMILAEDYQHVWLDNLSSKGYIQHIVDSLLVDNDQLRDLLLPRPEPLRALYIFQSKICLLTRISQTVRGAQVLLACELMSRLAECTMFDLRPEPERSTEGFIPTILARYRQQILFPVLRLCLSFLVSFGPDNQIAACKVLIFIISHVDIFFSILNDRQSVVTLEGLEELQLTTAVVSRAAIDSGVEELLLLNSSYIESKAVVGRLQRMMFALLSKYGLTEKQRKKLCEVVRTNSPTIDNETDLSVQVQLTVEEILANVMTLARTLVTRSGATSKRFRVLFGPSLTEGIGRAATGMEDVEVSTVGSLSRPPCLGLIVQLLNDSTQHFLSTLNSHKALYQKYLNVSDLSIDEIKELCKNEEIGDKISIQKRNQLAFNTLGHMLQCQTQELKFISYIIENCMFLLWRHLEFYFVTCMPSSIKSLPTMKFNASRSFLSETRASEQDFDDDSFITLGVSQDQLDQLKQESVACIGESLFKRLQDIEQNYTQNRTRYGFVMAIVRRVKRLLRLHTKA